MHDPSGVVERSSLIGLTNWPSPDGPEDPGPRAAASLCSGGGQAAAGWRCDACDTCDTCDTFSEHLSTPPSSEFFSLIMGKEEKNLPPASHLNFTCHKRHTRHTDAAAPTTALARGRTQSAHAAASALEVTGVTYVTCKFFKGDGGKEVFFFLCRRGREKKFGAAPRRGVLKNVSHASHPSHALEVTGVTCVTCKFQVRGGREVSFLPLQTTKKK
jgi:hypothetical protein